MHVKKHGNLQDTMVRVSATENTIAGRRSQINLSFPESFLSISTVIWRNTAIRAAIRLSTRPIIILNFKDMLRIGRKGKATWLKSGMNTTMVTTLTNSLR